MSIKDNNNGEIQVNPGMLPLSHKGVCCIDCVDKIEQMENAIIEVIERKKLSVAKKGGFDEFECDTTIIASAEPRSNKLSGKKTIMENFVLDECLLNKFDLVVLFKEEDKNKQTLNFKKELNIPNHNNMKIGRESGQSQDGRYNVVAERKILDCINNFNEIMEDVKRNDGNHCSKESLTIECYSDRLANIISTVGLENILTQKDVASFIAHCRHSYHPK
jgi:DNA replicative helicase MCM subunit Mcm2 (Cdc46/Mcm family)